MNKSKLLGVYKASIYRSKDKISGVRMHFRFAPVGTMFYYYRTKEGILLKTNPDKSKGPDAIRYVQASHTKTNGFTYISLKGFITKNTYFAIREHPEGYLLTEATVNEKEAFAVKFNGRLKLSGKISKRNYLSITRKDSDKLQRSGPNFIMALNFGERTYMEIFCVEDDSGYKKLNEIQKELGGPYSILQKDRIEYKVNPTLGLYFSLPIVFVKEGRVKPLSYLDTWFTPDNKMIVEVDPIICDICEKPIRRYEQGAVEIHLCGDCSKVIPTVSTYVKKSNKTTSSDKLKDAYNFVKQDLLELKNALLKLDNIITA